MENITIKEELEDSLQQIEPDEEEKKAEPVPAAAMINAAVNQVLPNIQNAVGSSPARDDEEQKVPRLPSRRIASNLLELVDEGEFDLDLQHLPISESTSSDETLIGNHTYEKNLYPKQTLS